MDFDRVFDSMEFRYPWRAYQERVLQNIVSYMDDNRLHIVAAPGAGKTILGLEVFRKLRKPALVLSPTKIIREQWLDRLDDFCGINRRDWTSNSIYSPKLLTSITYQALHVQFADELNSDEISKHDINKFIKTLKEHNIRVLILDEAHHLRSQWWRALEIVCKSIPDLILISLTATPPYNSDTNQWKRYEELCGEIDEEISIPELVKSKTLCPHQDYIWVCNASVDEEEAIERFDNQVLNFCNSMFENAQFLQIVRSHPWFGLENINNELIKEPETALSLLIFTKAKKIPLDKKLMEILDLTQNDIPNLTRHWWQVLLESVLFSKTFHHNEEQKDFIKHLKQQMSASGILKRKDVLIERNAMVEKSLSLSISKVGACLDINRLEYEQRGEGLRQVILVDFIRDESINSSINTGETSLGAFPIFNLLARHKATSNDIALLTGRLSIVTKKSYKELQKLIGDKKLTSKPLEYMPDYLKVSAPLNELTEAFTTLLNSGEIKVLVGTRSLLGEGWDAPCINSLILASSVGSFMLTNQMRGRAIRVDKNNKDKVSSIWHLVAYNKNSYIGWSDYYNLAKRFDTFVGLDNKKSAIQSGIERLDLRHINRGYKINSSWQMGKNNKEMKKRFANINLIAKRWQEALKIGKVNRVIPAVKIKKPPHIKWTILKDTFGHLLVQFSSILIVILYAFKSSLKMHKLDLLPSFLVIVIAGWVIFNIPKTLKMLKVLFRLLPTDGVLKQIGIALSEALCEANFINTSPKLLQVNCVSLLNGGFYVALSGGTYHESSIFSECMREILSPIQNPRYIITREGKFIGFNRIDYHAVPLKFATKKELAEIFHKSWCKYVSSSKLIYTRTDQGRKHLLRGKLKSFSSAFANEAKRIDEWM